MADPNDDATVVDTPAELLADVVAAGRHIAQQAEAAMAPLADRWRRNGWADGFLAGVREPRPVTPARVLAVLEVLGWPDDREEPAHVEDDGMEVSPPRWYWDLVVEAIEAADAAAVGGGA